MSKILIGKYEATIYPEGNGYTGAIDVGHDGTGRRQRIKRRGRTKTIVKDKLKRSPITLTRGSRPTRTAKTTQSATLYGTGYPKACEAAPPRPSRHSPSSPSSTSYLSSAQPNSGNWTRTR